MTASARRARPRPAPLPLLAALFVIATAGPAWGQAVGTFDGPADMSALKIFLMLFLMLGPIKVLMPFQSLTGDLDSRVRRRIARRAILFSAAALLIAALLGRQMLANFEVSLPVLSLTGGLILFLVALQTVMQGGPPLPAVRRDEASPDVSLALMPIAFPIIVTPHGIAAVIVFTTLAEGQFEGSSLVLGIVMAILALDWLAMRFAAAILRWAGTTLQIFGVVLGVTQVAIGLQIILHNLSAIGLFVERAP